jgi:MbtH protein
MTMPPSTEFLVIHNREGQYCVWPGSRPIPDGWRGAGAAGTKADCLAYVEKVWSDMRPSSLRRKMDREANRGER